LAQFAIKGTDLKILGLMTQLKLVPGPICLKRSDQTFYGTVFVSQKTCVVNGGLLVYSTR